MRRSRSGGRRRSTRAAPASRRRRRISGSLDPAAIARVRDEERPDPRDADELHDALVTAGFLPVRGRRGAPPPFLRRSLNTRSAPRALMVGRPPCGWPPNVSRRWRRHPRRDRRRGRSRHAAKPGVADVDARARDRRAHSQPAVAGRTDHGSALATSLAIAEPDATRRSIALETEGVVLRGRFSGAGELEWCDRRLLARIHRYTLNRLRAEIEPVSPADFQRFLFVWQPLTPLTISPASTGSGRSWRILDGVELPAAAWERAVLPARLDRYDPAWLDMLCLDGRSRLGAAERPASVRAAGTRRCASRSFCASMPTPGTRCVSAIEHEIDALEQRLTDHGAPGPGNAACARRVVPLRARQRPAPWTSPPLETPSRTWRPRVSSSRTDSPAFGRPCGRLQSSRRPPQRDRRQDPAGRWSPVRFELSAPDREAAIETQAKALLARYGVVFRRLLARETNAATWRESDRRLPAAGGQR